MIESSGYEKNNNLGTDMLIVIILILAVVWVYYLDSITKTLDSITKIMPYGQRPN